MIFFKTDFFSKIVATNWLLSKKNTNIIKEQNVKNKCCSNLNHNLKQLEFISCFEMHLDTNKEESYSLNFLQELENIKHYAQLGAMRSLQLCND